MKNILLITNELNTINGWATVGYHLNKELSKEYSIIVLSQNTDKNNKYNLITSNHYYNFYKLLKDYSTIKNSLHNKNFDLIICNIEPFLPLAVLLKKHFKSKLILIGHGTYIYYPFIKFPFKYYNTFWMKYVDWIVVPSNFTYNKVKEWWKKENISIVNWGVDISKYYPLDIKKEESFVFVGAQKERKGLDYLILAFKKLVKEYNNVKLYLVGKKSEKYMNIVKKLKLTNNIIFVGEVPHHKLLEYYSKSYAHVLPSVNTKYAFEGYGLVHLEANACGIPSIGSLGTANEEIILHKYNGFLVPQKNEEYIYKYLKLLLEDKKLLKKMCKNSLKFAKQNTWKKNLKPFFNIIENL